MEFPDAHIAWTFRNEADQNAEFHAGRSKKPWPESAHNYTNEWGEAFSQAMDLFQLAENGAASWELAWYQRVAMFAEKIQAPLVWGGNFKRKASDKQGWDSNHFELAGFVPRRKPA